VYFKGKNIKMKVLILNVKQPKIERFWGDETVVNAVSDSLNEGGLDVSIINSDTEKDVRTAIEFHNPDLVFPNGLYWLSEEKDRQYIPAVLESLDVPYVGSSTPTLSKMISKRRTKEALVSADLPTPKFVVFYSGYEPSLVSNLRFPVIVKPDEGAESMGIKKIEDSSDLGRVVTQLLGSYKQPVVVEEWCREREYTVAVIGNYNQRKIMPIEIKLPQGFEFLTNEVKEKFISQTACKVNTKKKNAIGYLVNKVCNNLDIQDWVRMEILESKGNFYVIDVNLVPGLRGSSNHPSYYIICAALNMGLNYTKTINALVYETIQRYGLKPPAGMKKLLDEYINQKVES